MTNIAKYTKPDLVTLLDELHVFTALVEMRIPTCPGTSAGETGQENTTTVVRKPVKHYP